MAEDGEVELPPIEEWWPKLSIDARHALLERLHAPLDSSVRAEIARITGRDIPENASLSHLDVGYAETQQQSVD